MSIRGGCDIAGDRSGWRCGHGAASVAVRWIRPDLVAALRQMRVESGVEYGYLLLEGGAGHRSSSAFLGRPVRIGCMRCDCRSPNWRRSEAAVLVRPLGHHWPEFYEGVTMGPPRRTMLLSRVGDAGGSGINVTRAWISSSRIGGSGSSSSALLSSDSSRDRTKLISEFVKTTTPSQIVPPE
jgi:hypothetical protein